MIIMAPPLFHKITEPDWPNVPPWFVVDSRALSELLGVSVQTLCLWRRRGVGPRPEPAGAYRQGPGGKRWYSLNQVMSWVASLRGIAREPWTFDKRFLEKLLPSSREISKEQAEHLKKMDVWSSFKTITQPRKNKLT